MSERLEAARRDLREALRAARTTLDAVRRGAAVVPTAPGVVTTGQDRDDARSDD